METLAESAGIDARLGEPSLRLLVVAARCGALLRPTPSASAPRALLVKLEDAASLVHAKPALGRLRARLGSGARLALWGTVETVAVAREMPEIDEVLVFDAAFVWRSLRRGLAKLRRAPPSEVYDLDAGPRGSRLLATLAASTVRATGAMERGGYRGDAMARLLDAPGDHVFGSWRPYPTQAGGRVPTPFLAVDGTFPRPVLEYLLAHLPSLTVAYVTRPVADPLPENGRVVDLAGKLQVGALLRVLHDAAVVATGDALTLSLAVTGPAAVVALPGAAPTWLPPGRPHTVTADTGTDLGAALRELLDQRCSTSSLSRSA